jgi:arsenical pump membrane protein
VPGPLSESISIALLVLTLGFAVARPRGLPEIVAAGPAAVLVVVTGIVPAAAALRTLRELGPTVAFLAAILLFGRLCAEAGVFEYLGGVVAGRSGGAPRRLLVLVVASAALVTATLTLDATVVLLTPVVLGTVRRLQLPARPHLYACTRLANSGSLVLPVSNLTNLLAFGASGLSFGRFTALMVLPWVVACVGEWGALRTWFRRDLAASGTPSTPDLAVPRYALAVLAATVASFPLAAALDIAPAWAAAAGCVALLVVRVRRRDITVRTVIGAAAPEFCLFVLALAVVVDGVTRHGLGTALRHLLPDGTSLGALLLIALLAAVLANVVNNLPATLALIPIVAGNPAWVLAVLLGVNIGPNATYPGSLATLLWRRLLPVEHKPSAAQFHRLGLATVPALIALATTALWASLQVLGA